MAMAPTDPRLPAPQPDTLNDKGNLGDPEVIADAKTFLTLCNAADGENRDDALDDLQFLSGDHWPDVIQRQREIEKRPCLTINKLPTFLHQVTNDQRMNVPGIKVSAVDDVTDPKTAEVVQGWVRHVEYDSNADVAYDTAVSSAAAIGFGYWRLVTDYCDPKSFDQDIRFQRIRNPFTVYLDPNSLEADGSDAKRCGISARVPTQDFKREYPNAQTTTQGFDVGTGDPTQSDWYSQDFIRVMEFYRIEYTADDLVQLPDGSAEYRSELEAAGVQIPPTAKTRPTQRARTMWYKLTAFEILESTEIMCPWIPVFPVYGDEIDLDGRLIRSGIIRHAKDPSKMYDFWMTAATEEVALRGKNPYVGAAGQFEGFEQDWNDTASAVGYREYNPIDVNGQLAPPPERQAMADIPNGAITMAMHANDNIKATTGLFDSSLGAQGNATSGIQERAQQRQGNIANFHYTDNLNRSVRHCGRCMVAMLPYYIDAPRLLRIMGEDGTVSSVQVNQPQQVQQPNPISGQMEVINTVLHDLTIGEYDVVVKSGPSYSTLRQEAADSMIEVGKSWPKLMDVAGDKVIAALDWPGAQGIAARIAKTIPPQILSADDEGGGEQQAVVNTPQGPIPVDQAAQMLQQMDQQIQQMGQKLQEAQSGVAKAQIDAQAFMQKAQLDAQTTVAKSKLDADTRVKVAEINAVSASDVAELNGLIKLLVAKLPPPPQLAADAAVQGDGAAVSKYAGDTAPN